MEAVELIPMLRLVRTTRAPMNPDCERWIDLSDRQAVGQPLPSDSREFLDRHARECDQCSKEAAHFRALLVPMGSEGQPSDQEVDNILLRATEKAPHNRGAGQPRWVLGAAAALAVAARLALWLRTGEAPSPIAAQSSTAPPVPARTAQPSAPTTQPTQSARAGCSEVVPGVLACTAEGTEISRRDLASPERFLELTRGHIVLSLEPQPQGTSFSIVTAVGRVTAVGTVFSVESSERCQLSFR